MGLDLSMTIVPVGMKKIFSKALEKSESEYPTILFSFPHVFKPDFCDFGHPDWIEFKEDAQSLLGYYPSKKFEDKYYFDSNRNYDVLDYLLSRYINDHNYTFFNEGIEFKATFEVQTRTLKYWDKEIIRRKVELITNIIPEDLMKHYDYDKMVEIGIYKITQINYHKENIEEVFVYLKSFLNEALKIDGYVLLIKD